ncbi:MAG: hypothetical protein HONBIEJF_01191 [Fimbriimonadaceae bacterium]|nr:hypothetical protein [Fimbriimonadaceae bacterium]
MQGAVGDPTGKMGYGLLRYRPDQIVAVIDSTQTARALGEVAGIDHPAPIVTSVADAMNLGADVLILGIAPSGGKLPEEWLKELDIAIESGMSLVNGLHDKLAVRYGDLGSGQFVWDIRTEPDGIGVGTAKASKLAARRILMVGTDMAVGKMTAGLELLRAARERGIDARFVATGQIGIAITGKGVPLDAIRLDYACGAVESAVLDESEGEWIIVEGQGAINHPGSTATLPLLRGSCPTHLILCCRAGQDHLLKLPEIAIPPLRDLIKLYEDLGGAGGTFPRPKTVGVAVNTSHLDEAEACRAVRSIEAETGLPATDPVRFGCSSWLDSMKV